jgi:hypothetical protein
LVKEPLRGASDFHPIIISAGQTVIWGPDGSIQVPKKDLIGTLQLLLQNRRLRIAHSLPFAETLVEELENYRVKITLLGNETVEEWRERQHDDLVFAVAMAAWMADLVAACRLRLRP